MNEQNVNVKAFERRKLAERHGFFLSKVPKFHGYYKQNSTQKLTVLDITSDPQDISQAQNLRYV